MQAFLRRAYRPAELLSLYPPEMRHPNKQIVFDLACPPDGIHSGLVELTRWEALALPETVDAAHAPSPTDIAPVPDVYDYGSDDGVWHVNFADPELFVAFASSLLAQDELQCAEHPALCSLRLALLDEGQPARTEDEGAPTPVLVTGVERRCELDTRVLYGNRFAAASASMVREHTRVLSPPTRSNIIAIAAPTGGPGPYWRRQIDHILVTAYTGFAAAAYESRRLWPDAAVEIRTGFWGCGAFGGNRTLMTMLQLLAARMANVDRLRFYTVTPAGVPDYATGAAALEDVLARATPGEPLDTLLERISDLDLEWGVGNGT